jgi:hypothetical protein
LSEPVAAVEMAEAVAVELVDSDQHLVQLLVQEILVAEERLSQQ